VRPGELAAGTELVNPFGIAGWPGILQAFVELIPLEMVALLALGAAAVITRYRRGDRIERLQIRWLASAVMVIAVGLTATVLSFGLGNDNPPIRESTTLIAYAGILLMPVAIGIAVLRYRLFEIDRIISRTIAWAVVTGVLGVVFAATVVGLQTVLNNVTQGETLAVAGSTFVAFAVFQPVRRRVQSVVDRRFNRARYDAERTATAFAGRQRDQTNIAGLRVDLVGTIDAALHPQAVGVWIRPSGHGRTP
jgi:drug/metabolite transporter (DMT)-like permease